MPTNFHSTALNFTQLHCRGTCLEVLMEEMGESDLLPGEKMSGKIRLRYQYVTHQHDEFRVQISVKNQDIE